LLASTREAPQRLRMRVSSTTRTVLSHSAAGAAIACRRVERSLRVRVGRGVCAMALSLARVLFREVSMLPWVTRISRDLSRDVIGSREASSSAHAARRGRPVPRCPLPECAVTRALIGAPEKPAAALCVGGPPVAVPELQGALRLRAAISPEHEQRAWLVRKPSVTPFPRRAAFPHRHPRFPAAQRGKRPPHVDEQERRRGGLDLPPSSRDRGDGSLAAWARERRRCRRRRG
jgi:hypothetical protein